MKTLFMFGKKNFINLKAKCKVLRNVISSNWSDLSHKLSKLISRKRTILDFWTILVSVLLRSSKYSSIYRCKNISLNLISYNSKQGNLASWKCSFGPDEHANWYMFSWLNKFLSYNNSGINCFHKYSPSKGLRGEHNYLPERYFPLEDINQQYLCYDRKNVSLFWQLFRLTIKM